MDLPRKHSVLVVDDDSSIRLLLTTFLQRRGFRSLEACNGREAIQAMEAGKAGVVILDLMMPASRAGMFCAAERQTPRCNWFR